MKTYNVIWTERHSVNVKASTKEEATQKAYNCEYDEASLSAEIDTPPEAYELNLCALCGNPQDADGRCTNKNQNIG